MVIVKEEIVVIKEEIVEDKGEVVVIRDPGPAASPGPAQAPRILRTKPKGAVVPHCGPWLGEVVVVKVKEEIVVVKEEIVVNKEEVVVIRDAPDRGAVAPSERLGSCNGVG